MAAGLVNVLCLDGGGVRGLSSLLILKSLLQQLAMISNLQIMPRPCEVFDLICGTSTGGIIALMLGRLRMNVDDAIACFLDFCRTVFDEKRAAAQQQPLWGRLWSTFFGRTDLESHTSEPMYDASNLEKWIKNTVAKYGGDEEALLRDPVDGTDDFCRTFVVATTKAYADAPPKLFRTYRAEGRPADPCKIWEAARATTAAAPFFDPATFGMPQVTYIDGSFAGSSNPSHLAIDEISHVFPSRQLGCFLSLGTGVPDAVSTGDSLDDVAKACMEVIKSCERVHNFVWKVFARRKQADARGVYFRFSVDRRPGKVELDEWNRVEVLAGITDGYMRFNEVEEKAGTCIETLRARAVEIADEEWEQIEWWSIYL